jgi:chemotaxis protein histidine kinase CheA
MGQTDLNSYKNLYLQTAKEYVNNMFLSYSKLSTNLQDNEAISVIHLSSHSLKSQSQVMGFKNIADLCANIEKTSSDIKDGAVQTDDKFIIFLKDSIDKIQSQLTKIESGDII